MNYGQLKTQVMQLMFSESIAGEFIPPTYNNQVDYTLAIPGLVDDCATYIATTVKKIPALVPLTELEYQEFDGYRLYAMPANFWRLNNGGLIWRRPSLEGEFSYQRFHQYKLYANNKLMISSNAPNLDQMIVEYYRYPVSVGPSPGYSLELDNTPDTHAAMPYYVAAQLLMYDDPFRYASLWNAFETRLSRITEPITTEFAPIDSAYDFNVWGV